MENEIRRCKKCRCELSDYTKGKLCDNCRKKKNSVIKKVLGVVLTILLFPLVIVGKIIIKKFKKNNESK